MIVIHCAFTTRSNPSSPLSITTQISSKLNKLHSRPSANRASQATPVTQPPHQGSKLSISTRSISTDCQFIRDNDATSTLMEQHKAERRAKTQRVITTATRRARARAPEDLTRVDGTDTGTGATAVDIDSSTYDAKVRVNHWHDTMMEHKKIYYAAELKMFKLELALAKFDNSNKKRWSVRHREMANLVHHEEAPPRPTLEPAFGYVPITRRLTSEEPNDSEKRLTREETIESEDRKDEDAENADETNDIISIQSGPSTSSSKLSAKPKTTIDNDIIPIHSEDYKPFADTASIHSYMYHLRKIYGK